MGSLSAKNASEKFSCLGTFKLSFSPVIALCRSGLVRSRISDKPKLKLSFFSSNFIVKEWAGEEPDIGQYPSSS
jgi:hypothetical protein